MDDLKQELKSIMIFLVDELESRGLELNEDECTLHDAADYIRICRMHDKYSKEQWVDDTLKNYPECFKK